MEFGRIQHQFLEMFSPRETFAHIIWPWRNSVAVPRPGISGFFGGRSADNKPKFGGRSAAGGPSSNSDTTKDNTSDKKEKLLMIEPNPPSMESETNIREALRQIHETEKLTCKRHMECSVPKGEDTRDHCKWQWAIRSLGNARTNSIIGSRAS